MNHTTLQRNRGRAAIYRHTTNYRYSKKNTNSENFGGIRSETVTIALHPLSIPEAAVDSGGDDR